MHRIKAYKPYKGVPIFRDFDVGDDEQVYIGNGQGCRTFWFKSVRDARKFIRAYRDRMKITFSGAVIGLIPKELCENCKGHWSWGSPEWNNARDWNCFEFKEQLKKAVLDREK